MNVRSFSFAPFLPFVCVYKGSSFLSLLVPRLTSVLWCYSFYESVQALPRISEYEMASYLREVSQVSAC